MDRFDAMYVFVSVAEQQSFAAAARRHGLSAARVTRSVAALEARIGARLLHRTTRAVRLTDAGATYLNHCKRILAEVEQAESLAATSHRELSGSITITAPVVFGRLHVAPIVSAFLARHPRVAMRVVFADQVVDLFEQNIDVAVRIARLPDSSMHAVRVGAVRRVVCGSPSYLRARGVPEHPRELAEHDTISTSTQTQALSWSFAIDGRSERFAVRSRLVANAVDMALVAARAGQGLTRALSYQIVEDLAADRLRILLDAFEHEPVPVHVVRSEARGASARVRAFADFAGRELRVRLR